MSFYYKLRVDYIYDDIGKLYLSYGIDATNSDTNEIIISVPHISVDRSTVDEMVNSFNTYELSLLHFKDVIEDHLQ